jgi:hypothetical protein
MPPSAHRRDEMVEFHLGDLVRLRKPHPCGGTVWAVVRLGADIGLQCLQCQRRVLLPRSTVERRMKGLPEPRQGTQPLH